jgi:hypothetical protein
VILLLKNNVFTNITGREMLFEIEKKQYLETKEVVCRRDWRKLGTSTSLSEPVLSYTVIICRATSCISNQLWDLYTNHSPGDNGILLHRYEKLTMENRSHPVFHKVDMPSTSNFRKCKANGENPVLSFISSSLGYIELTSEWNWWLLICRSEADRNDLFPSLTNLRCMNIKTGLLLK